MGRINGRSSGFSLVELMVSVAIALVVIGSAMALMVSVMRANASNVTTTRLTQELRAVNDLVVMELRRARFLQDSITFVGEARDDDNGDGVVNSDDWAPVNLYEGFLVTGGGADDNNANTTDGQCVRFGYEGAENGEFRTISRRDVDGVGAVFMGRSGAPPYVIPAPPAVFAPPYIACNATAIRLSSQEVNITLLAINYDPATDWVRVTVEGRLRNGPDDLRRRYSQALRIRGQVMPPLPPLPPAP